jgi:hypothetical protein
MLDYKLPNEKHALGVEVMTLFSIVTFLLTISALFLADALCRLNKSFKAHGKLVVNKKTMCLHINALFVHTSIQIACQYFTIYQFINPSTEGYKYADISRMLLFSS